MEELFGDQWEYLSEIRSSSIRRFNKRYIHKLSSEDVQRICDYLRDPTSYGFWELRFKVDHSKGFFGFITSQLKSAFAKNDVKTAKIRGSRRKLDEDSQSIMIQISERFSFIYYLFTYLNLMEKVKTEEEGEDPESKLETDVDASPLRHLETLERDFNEDFQVLEFIDWDTILKEYISAYTVFKDFLYFDGFHPRIYLNQINWVKDGFFVVQRHIASDYPQFPVSDQRICIAFRPEPLKYIKKFYEELGILVEANLVVIFSPEEKVFDPYFTLLEQVYPAFTDTESIQKKFKEAISEFRGKNYSYCISKVGLIAEDYLIRVYETLFREANPKVPMGQLFDTIQKKINNQFQAPPTLKPEVNPLYRRINNLLSTPDSNTQSVTKETLEITRDILTFIKDDKVHTIEMLKSIKDKSPKTSCFPKHIRANIIELIRNRNAITHTSRVPIGEYEALRSVYCCVTLILWWMDEQKLIDWHKSAEEIIDDLVHRHSGKEINQP